MRNKIQLSLFLTLLIFGVQGNFATIFANPAVEFSYTGVCAGSPTVFTVDETITNVPAVTVWQWDFGDGTFETNQNPVHTYAGFGIYTITLTITDTNGVIGIISHNITIQKLPVSFFSFDILNCSNDSIQFTDLSSPTNGFIKQWVWNFDDGSPDETILFPDDPNLKHIFPNPGKFDVTLSVMNTNTCENQISREVTVAPSPIADFYFNGKCEDQLVTFTDASFANGAGNIAAWDWDFGDVTSGINNKSNLTAPTHKFNNVGTYTVKLIVTNFNGCTDSIVKQVVINAHPPVEFTNATNCLGEPVTFNPDPSITNIPSIAYWLWDFGDGTTSQAPSPANTYQVSGDYMVSFTVTDTMGCMNVVSHSIKIDPLPVAQFSTNFSYCAGGGVQFQDLSSTSAGNYISSWEWDFGDGATLLINHPDDPNISHVYTLAGSYNVTLTIKSSEGCTGTGAHFLIIHPNPLANFAFTTACTGTPAEFTDLTQLNGAGSIVQWQWNFGDPASGISNYSSLQHPEHSFVATGNSIVQLIVTSGDGCTDTITHTVLVNTPPPVNFNTTHNCQNDVESFIPDTGVMNLSAIASWYWDFGAGVTSALQNPTHIFSTAGQHNVILTIVDTAGCTNTISRQVIIAPQPIVDFSFPQPTCTQSSVQFDNLSSVPGGYIVKSEWNFGDGNTQMTTTLASVLHTYASFGSYNVTLTVTTNDSCIKSLALLVVILPTPAANFTFSGSCLNSPVQFNDLSQPGVGGIIGWKWNFGDIASGTSNSSDVKLPTHTYNAAGTFPVSLIVSNSGGCLDTIVKQVLVHGLPVVDFSSSPGCVNESTHFTSSTFVNAGVVVSRSWNFGDGHTLQSIDPSNIYTSSGSFTVTLTVTDTAGCISTKTHTVVIAAPPSALFEISPQICAGNTMSFSVLPSPPGNNITSYFWEFGDGSDTLINAPANGNVSHTYAAGNNYTAVLTVQTSLGCKAQSQRTVIVYPSPTAQFNFDNTCAGFAVNFNDFSLVNSGPSIVNWSWNFNDPTSFANNTSGLQNPYHVFNIPGTYKVILLVKNSSGCNDTVSKSVVINPKPTVDFDWSGSCIGSSTKFTINSSVTNVAAIASNNWDFGDGTAHSTTLNPVHNYTVPGNHTVILTIVNTTGCKNSVSHNITTFPQPNVVFSSNSSCLGASTQFNDQSFVSNGVPITAWHWDFGVNTVANDTSNQQNPLWTYDALGVYQVKLAVTSQNGCQNAVTLPSQIFGNPTANFTYSASPCGNGAVFFQDSSYNKQAPIVSFKWEFESNHFSTLQDPAYVFYSSDSCYEVRLIATDIRGCIDTVVKQACVPAEYNFSFVATNNCLFDSTYFTPQQLGTSSGTLVSFIWNFGDPKSGPNNTSTKKTPTHYYDQPGIYTISLSATDIYDCSRTVYHDITVLPLPVSYFTSTQNACDSSVNFNESSYSTGSDIIRWIWDFGDGVIRTIVAPDLPDVSHQYAVTGIYSVSLTVTNTTGCTTKTTVNDLLVKPCLAAAFGLNDTMICQNNTLSFTDNSNTSNAMNEWYWDFGDGTHTKYSTYTNRITHKFESSGTFNVQLILSTNVAGLKVSDTAKMNVLVNPTPLPDFTFGVVCFEQSAVFTNMTSGNGTKISSYNWTFGEPLSDTQDTSTLKNPAHQYNAPGTYEIKLVVKNMLGCTDSIQKLLIVHGLPDANYTYSVSCAGNNTSFVDLSVAAITPLVNWEWTFYDEMGVTGKADIQNPGFIFVEPGDYLVNLKVSDVNGCSDTLNQHVTTWSVPTSLFSYTTNFDEVQGQIQFLNSSVNATRYYWDFGDGTDSYTENPIVNYENDGTYDITLITWNDKECSDTLSMQYEFMVKGLFIPNAFSPNNLKTEVQLLKPVGINLNQYRFEVFDRWGNLLWWTDKLDPAGRPVEGWDGKYKGTLMPEGAYPWRAFGVFNDGSIWEAENVGNNTNLPNFKVGTATMIK